jgi:hypothetical protein
MFKFALYINEKYIGIIYGQLFSFSYGVLTIGIDEKVIIGLPYVDVYTVKCPTDEFVEIHIKN